MGGKADGPISEELEIVRKGMDIDWVRNPRHCSLYFISSVLVLHLQLSCLGKVFDEYHDRAVIQAFY